MTKKSKHKEIIVADDVKPAITIEILKAKITKEMTLEVEYEEHISDDTINEVSKKCDNLVHDDLKNAFADLKPHLALICDLKEGIRLDISDYDAEQLASIEVTGIVVTHGDQAGVTLIGKKRIGNKVLNLVAPFTKYTDEQDPYEHADELSSSVDICVNEVQLYLTEGKAAAKQQQIDFDQNGEE